MSSAIAQLFLSALDDNDFETWLVAFFRASCGLDQPPQRFGRRGQRQHGVDLYFRQSDDTMVGVQAKAYTDTILTPSDIDHEVRLAHGFKPELSRYIICTLNRRSTTLQTRAASATIHGRPAVQIYALDDLAEEATRHPGLIQELIQLQSSQVVDEMRAVFSGPQTPGAALVPSGALESEPGLRRIQEWIDAGDPTRALADLDSYSGPASSTALRRVRTRALLTLGETGSVLGLATAERGNESPDPLILAYGAMAAQSADNRDLADALIDQAAAYASGEDQHQVVGAYLRIHADRSDLSVETLEAYARGHVGDPLVVALALADACFVLGDAVRAMHWYEQARGRQGAWPPIAQANAVSAELWHLIDEFERGHLVRDRLDEVATELGVLARRLPLSKHRAPVLSNVGLARYVLQDAGAAAAAWDQALASQHASNDVWLRRCVLSATYGVALPDESLEAHYATTPIARLALAAACTTHQAWDRTAALITAVRDQGDRLDPNERALLGIETIRLATRDDESAVTAEHVAAMLQFASPGEDQPALLLWLVEHYEASGPDDVEAVRGAIAAMASDADLDPMRRLAIAEELVRVGLDDIAIAWLPRIEQGAFWPDGRVRHLRAVDLLLRLFPRAFRIGDTRALVEQVKPFATHHPRTAAYGARALADCADRPAAYAFLTDAIEAGQQHIQVLLLWAQLAVMTGHRRHARRVLTKLSLAPDTPTEHAALLELRKLVGTQGRELLPFTPATQVTPATAGAIFSASLQSSGQRALPVAYGRVVSLRIVDGGVDRFNENVLLLEHSGVVVEGVRSYAADDYPWVNELLGAEPNDTRVLTQAPFAGAEAHIQDVFDAERWSFLQAIQMLHTLPQETTGVEAFTFDPATIHDQLAEQLTRMSRSRGEVLRIATQSSLPIALTAARLNMSPRALLEHRGEWKPAGHPGNTAAVAADERVARGYKRLVLDPVTTLLLVELGAEDLLANGPKAVMTNHGAQQLVDWWYAHERIMRGTRGHMVPTPDGPRLLATSASGRRATHAYWRRVQRFVRDRVELWDPEGTDDSLVLRLAEMLGRPIVSGMVLAKQRGWVYVTEERMVRALCADVLGVPTAPLHRVAVVSTETHAWPLIRGMELVTALIMRGWRWVGFPTSWLHAALRLPGSQRWRMFMPMAKRLRRADPPIAIQAIASLLMRNDEGQFWDINPRRLREILIDVLPPVLGPEERLAVAKAFNEAAVGPTYRRSRQAVAAWSRRTALPAREPGT